MSALAVTGTMVGRWERDGIIPRPPYPELLCLLFDTTADELGLYQPPAELRALEADMRRGELLQLAATAAGAAVLTPFTRLAGAEVAERICWAMRRPRQLDNTAVEHLEAITVSHREMYHYHSSFELVDAVTGHLRVATSLLSGVTEHPSALRRRVAAVVGETAGHAAWLLCDLNRREAAEECYGIAAIATREAGDPALASYVQGFQSTVRLDDGDIAEASKLAQTARDSGRRNATATTRAWLKAIEAQTLAAAGETTPCASALREAETALEQSRPEADPAWMFDFDHARFAVIEGSTYRVLGQHLAAEHKLTEALDALEPGRDRRRSEILMELAAVAAGRERIDEACERAIDSFNAAASAGTAAGVRRVHRFRTRLDPWRESWSVARLDEVLLGTL